MKPLMPWAETQLELEIRQNWFGHLLGESPIRVLYLIPSTSQAADSIELHPRYDQVDMGIEFVTASGKRVLFAWTMQGELEGLFIGFIDAEERLASIAGTPLADEWRWERIDMSGDDRWTQLLGRTIKQVAVSWRECTKSVNSIWAVRLGFDSDSATVIALGETLSSESGNPPDSILAIFDQAEAQNYRPPGAYQSAWGELIVSSAD
jgi:hypothetical protein